MTEFLNKYQREAVKTAIYPDASKIVYPAMGLVGEVGEFANKLKKVIRDEDSVLTDEKRDELAKELGDVMWYIAALSRDLDFDLDVFNGEPFADVYPNPPYEIDPYIIGHLLNLTEYAASVIYYVNLRFVAPTNETYNSPEYTSRCQKHLYEAIEECYMLARLLGTSLEDVCNDNLAKLKARAEKGTLQGNGDNR